MDTKNESELIFFREEYERSGLSTPEFARSKNMEYWKVNYALRKALRYKNKTTTSSIGFKKLSSKPIADTNKEIRIKTSYGAEIIIPL